MPRTVADAHGKRPWSEWTPPTMPALSVEPWAGFNPFWRDRIDDRPIDHERTRALVDFDLDIRIGAGGDPWLGTSIGHPFQLVGSAPTTPVWDQSQPVRWRGLTPVPPIVHTPLPPLVRRSGDPAGAFDMHWIGWNEQQRVLWEAITLRYSPFNRLQTLGRCEWVAGYSGGGRGVIRWDCRQPWDAPGQPRGVVAAKVPRFPMMARWDEVQRGRIGHCLFGVLPNYAPARVGHARGFDGDWVGHPVRAGELLRLRREVVERFEPGTAARIVADAFHEHGMFNGDRSNPAKGVRSGIAVASLTQDRRWAQGDDRLGPLGDMGLRLSDFEVIAQ